MTPQNFVYWLNGFVEIQNPQELTKEQWQTIKDHLALTVNKVTPNTLSTIDNPFWTGPHIVTRVPASTSVC